MAAACSATISERAIDAGQSALGGFDWSARHAATDSSGVEGLLRHGMGDISKALVCLASLYEMNKQSTGDRHVLGCAVFLNGMWQF